jgi:hypothetical protein
MYRVLWIGLLTNLADDQGRMPDNPMLIRSKLFPYDAQVTVKDIEKGLTLFANKHKIVRYHAGTNGDGRELIQIVNWWRYQKSTQWAAKSQYPSPAKWADRIRTHVSGGGSQPFTMNWDHAGGFTPSVKPLRSGKIVTKVAAKVATTKRLASREEEVKEEEEREGGVKDSGNGAVTKKNPHLLSSKSSKEPKAFANLRKAKAPNGD